MNIVTKVGGVVKYRTYKKQWNVIDFIREHTSFFLDVEEPLLLYRASFGGVENGLHIYNFNEAARKINVTFDYMPIKEISFDIFEPLKEHALHTSQSLEILISREKNLMPFYKTYKLMAKVID